MWGPLTEGLLLPEVLHLSERETAMGQLGIRPSQNAQLVSLVKETIGSDREAGLLVSARAWPLLAARMICTARGPEDGPGLSPQGEAGLRARLNALADNSAWKQGPASELTGRLVAATLTALTARPTDGTPTTGPRVSAAAARASSTTTTGPAPRQPAPAAPAAVPAHRQQPVPARRQGRGR
ncbi:hypothetical protein AB0I86_26750 [Streptomyces sp. NPDC049950]|uniref:hypothetical protein n=1 Tax=Streptomyces sp. NPDC049950 TaxID=3156659 RepID=UPI003424C605